MSREDRAQTMDAYLELYTAAEDARLDGWRRWEVPEVIYAKARRLGVGCWPALALRLQAEAWPSGQR